MRKNYEAQVKKGKLKQDKLDARMAMLGTTLNYADLKDADLVIEAVFEQMDVKEKVFRKLDLAVKQGAILATNTSTLDVDRIASFTFRPQDVVGLHFFSPANVMKLLEVVRGEKTAKDVLATVMPSSVTTGCSVASPRSTTKRRTVSPSRAETTSLSAQGACITTRFFPVSRNPAPACAEAARDAFAFTRARSYRAPSSRCANAITSRPSAMAGSSAAFCASLPWTRAW